jgi:phosphoglycolate phosphatase
MILFDLDGTLVDTAPDLALALNLQRQKHGLQDLPLDVIRSYASHGSKGLLSIGFGLSDKDDLFNAMRVEYLDLYDEVFTRNQFCLMVFLNCSIL